MSMIMIWRHGHVLLISQYWLLRVNIHSKSLESLDHQAPWLSNHIMICRWTITVFLKEDISPCVLCIMGWHSSLWFCSHIQIGNKHISPSISAWNLGVNFNSGMTLEAHVNSVVSAAFYHIKNIGSIRNNLTQEAAYCYSGPCTCDIKTGLL